MEYRRKKDLTFITIGIIFLMSGLEYAVILPTIWKYLQILGAAPYFLGLGLSAFSLSGLLSGPLFGSWSDQTRATKKIILLANIFEIVGNFMYFIGYSKWLLLSSRLVAGIGAGAGSSIFGFITWSTAPEDRARVFAVIMACRQAGLLIGPAFNIFLRLCDFQLGPFEVNKFTSPGLFMCLLWVLLQFVVMFMYWDLPSLEPGYTDMEMKTNEEVEENNEGEEEARPLVTLEEPAEALYCTVNNSEQPEDDTTTKDHLSPLSPPPSPSLRFARSNPFRGFSEFLREEVVVLLTAQFITLFNQTALETMVTPLTQKYFNFGELENSVMYSMCGVEVIAGFFLVHWLSRRAADRVVLAVGLAICIIACTWCLIFLADPLGGYSWSGSQPIYQWFSQGIRRSVGGLATILGPLWAGGLTGNLHLMLGLMMSLLAMLTIMTVFSYERLIEPCVVHHADSSKDHG